MQRRKHKILSNNGLGGIDDDDDYDEESIAVSHRDYNVEKAEVASVEDARDDEGKDGGSEEKVPAILKTGRDGI